MQQAHPFRALNGWWKPIQGILPPEPQNGRRIHALQGVSEYQILNKGMSLEALSVFLLGVRASSAGQGIGLLFFIPLVYFWFTKQIQQVQGAFSLRLVWAGAKG